MILALFGLSPPHAVTVRPPVPIKGYVVCVNKKIKNSTRANFGLRLVEWKTASFDRLHFEQLGITGMVYRMSEMVEQNRFVSTYRFWDWPQWLVYRLVNLKSVRLRQNGYVRPCLTYGITEPLNMCKNGCIRIGYVEWAKIYLNER